MKWHTILFGKMGENNQRGITWKLKGVGGGGQSFLRDIFSLPNAHSYKIALRYSKRLPSTTYQDNFQDGYAITETK